MHFWQCGGGVGQRGGVVTVDASNLVHMPPCEDLAVCVTMPLLAWPRNEAMEDALSSSCSEYHITLSSRSVRYLYLWNNSHGPDTP